MNPRHGLPQKTVAQVVAVLARFPELDRAVLFGSRAKASHKPGSDIDLALVGAALDWRTVGRIYDALDDLLLPHRFSLIIHDANTDPEVAAHIARVGIPFFERTAAGGELDQKVNKAIRNVFAEGELEAGSVVKESLTTAADGTLDRGQTGEFALG